MVRYIDAEKIIQRVRNEINEQVVLTNDIGFKAFLQGFLKLFEQKIREEPTADVQEIKHGEWIDERLDKFRKWKSTCSVCGWYGVSNYDSYVDVYDFSYCPNCGAKMDKE